jgi:hypothetical protein
MTYKLSEAAVRAAAQAHTINYEQPDEIVYASIYRAICNTDPLAAAERAVFTEALKLAGPTPLMPVHLRPLCLAIDEYERLRAAQQEAVV